MKACKVAYCILILIWIQILPGLMDLLLKKKKKKCFPLKIFVYLVFIEGVPPFVWRLYDMGWDSSIIHKC